MSVAQICEDQQNQIIIQRIAVLINSYLKNVPATGCLSATVARPGFLMVFYVPVRTESPWNNKSFLLTLLH